MTKAELKKAANAQIVLIFSEPRFPQGALLTQRAYEMFVASASDEELASHAAELVDAGAKGLSKFEFVGSMELQ